MIYIKSNDWTTQGIESLEYNAELVVKDISDNIIVTAGPGAGKTELLAQKAAYILQTGSCNKHKKILAISFKKDAAKNLKERVELRCGKVLSKQFDSMTFDSFAKGLFDRFKLALPKYLEIKKDYILDFNISNKREMAKLLDSIGLTTHERQSLSSDTFEQYHLTSKPLPISEFNINSIETKATSRLWDYLLKQSTPARISFSMIGRLIELIFRTNPKLLFSLQSTYDYVFLDEFQDTTSIQYDLIKTCFLSSNIKITAVGDDKQTIMSWAGALANIFNIYKSDFGAQEYQLINNYRSSPELVNIQNIIIQNLMGLTISKTVAQKSTSVDNCCKLYSYVNENDEAIHISKLVKELISEKSIPKNEICILTKQQPEIFTDEIQKKLLAIDIKSRVENELQDLLSEPFTKFIICLIRLVFMERSAESWKIINDYMLIGHSDNQKDNVKNIDEFIKSFKVKIPKIEYSEAGITDIIGDLTNFLNENILKTIYKQYSQGTYFNDLKANIIKHLFKYLIENSNDWIKSIDSFEGKDSVKIMTMHKSKGLEFNTVFFVGLEDEAFWNYQKNPIADNNGFFVAFSRAKERIIFTISHRTHYRYDSTIKTISPILQVFNKAKINLEVQEMNKTSLKKT